MLLIYEPTRDVDRLVTDGMILGAGQLFVIDDVRARSLIAQLWPEVSAGAETLALLSRRQLDIKASAVGVREPGKLGSKPAVIRAITLVLTRPPPD